MKLTDYQWSRNPRGMHNQGNPDPNRIFSQKFGWMKLVALGSDYVSLCPTLLANNVTPIIRIYRPTHSGVPIDAEMRKNFQEYLSAGAKWFEIYNEPNLGIEWPSGVNFDPFNTSGVIAPICNNWLDWAEFIIENGGYPGFIPLTEAGGGGWENTINWINQLSLYMFDNHYNRFSQVLANGFWIPTHPYILNHFYQEIPGQGELSARPPETQNYAEGGWHFEYPYDPISQAGDPGRTVWGGTPLSPTGDVHGVIGSGVAWIERLRELFGIGAVPVVGTEGGLWPLPKQGQIQQMDTRYPGFSWESHAHATVAMFDWISREAPPWFWGVALWKWDHYYDPSGGGPMPAAGLLEQTNPLPKDVEGLDTLDGVEPPPATVIIEPPGPGPVRGEPTYHFIVLAPGIDETWFFTFGKVYWERFRPMLMTVYEFINFLPKDTSLAVTVLTTPDLVDLMNNQIQREWPNVYMDFIVGTESREIEEILNSRVAAGRRFG